MSLLLNTIEQMEQSAIETAGNLSDALRESGAHLATIKAVYETTAANYTSLTAEFETANGSVRLFEFAGKVKPEDANDAKAIEKANTKTKKVVSILARLAKAVGLKDVKLATQGSVSGVDAKGNPTTTFPKFAAKKLNVVTYKEISPDQKGLKAYANQTVDTFKFLDKDGKDGMGRERLEAFDTEAKSRIEIHWQETANPLCIQLLQVEQEKLLGSTPTPAVAPLTAMPTATAAVVAPIVDDSDI